MASPSAASSPANFEAAFVRPNTSGRVLIIGSQVYREKEDRRLRYERALGVDMLPGPGVDRVLDFEQPLPEDLGTFSHIECLSVLEHSKQPWLIAANIQRCIEPAGTLYVSVPFCWRVHGYPDDYWRLTPSGVRMLFPAIAWSAVRLGFGGQILEEGEKIPSTKREGLPWFPRTETFGFGVFR